ncbi:MAG: hypothetical protein AAF497_04705 [Planctomycetota bacterium]
MTYAKDIEVRGELARGIIVDERDYVSSLMTSIRRESMQLGLSVSLQSQQLPSRSERMFGCDGVVSIFNELGVKFLLFEAKWPRLGTSGYPWDYLQSSGISHFTDQIRRQNAAVSFAAVVELFIVELHVGTKIGNFDSEGSTLISHFDAHDYDDQTRKMPHIPWTQENVKQMVRQKHPYNMRTIVQCIGECNLGVLHRREDNQVVIEEQENVHEISLEQILGRGPEVVAERLLEIGFPFSLAINVPQSDLVEEIRTISV